MPGFKGLAHIAYNPGTGNRYFNFTLVSAYNGTFGDQPNWDFGPMNSLVGHWNCGGVDGASPPSAPNKVRLALIDVDSGLAVYDSGVVVVAGGAGTLDFGTMTLYPTSTGAAGGAPLIGTYKMLAQYVRDNAPGGVGNYNINTDSTAGAVQGVVRFSPSTAVLAVSVPSGLSPHAYGDVQTWTVTLSHGSKAAASGRRFDVLIRKSDLSAAYKTGTTTATAGTAHSAAASSVGPPDYPAGATTVVADATPTVASITPNSEPNMRWIKMPSSSQFVDNYRIRTSTFVVDPRLYRQPLFQLDDNTFGTPPSSKDVPDHRRKTSQQGFLGSRTKNARGEGVNGITYSVTLTPRKPGTAISQTGLVTSTQGGQTGWSPSLLPWSSSLPGGIWDKAVTITAPAGITSAYVVQEGSTEYSLVARDDDLLVAVNVQHEPGLGGRHFEAGMALIASAYLVNARTGVRVPFASLESMHVALVRVSTAANPDGTGGSFEYLAANGTWTPWASGPRTTFPMAVSPADTHVGERRFATDATWGLRDIRFIYTIQYEGVLYINDLVVINVGSKNRHDGLTFDPTGLFS